MILFLMDKVTFEDFEKFDFRVGRIISAREHPKADKLFTLGSGGVSSLPKVGAQPAVS